mmetsp:Transcript_3388/g.6650  ORF Transcript_3388/g.6650 Transcript_3388/m.6650 type:complete len:464 (-) Transcript_3388:468-1859(-)
MRGAEPSKVVHVRNLPPGVTEQDLVNMGMPFGPVTQVLVMNSKGQGFIEFQSVDSASRLYTMYAQTGAQFGGRIIYFQYSERQELNIQPRMDASRPAAPLATPNRVLILQIRNFDRTYYIDADMLYKVFSNYGKILRIAMFQKEGKPVQAFVEFDSIPSATSALSELQGRHLFGRDIGVLSIDYSKLETVTIRSQSEKARDYTLPQQFTPKAPVGGGNFGEPAIGGGGGAGGAPLTMGFGGGMAQFGMHGQGMGPQSGCVVLVNNLDPQMMTTDKLFNLFSFYGTVLRVKIVYSKRDTALVQFDQPDQASAAISNLNGVDVYGKPLSVQVSRMMNVQLPKTGAEGGDDLTKDFTDSPLQRVKKGRGGVHPVQRSHCAPSSVVHVANINPSLEEETLRDLFSSYGENILIRFLPPKEGSTNKTGAKMALIQLDSVETAVHALMEKHNETVMEFRIRVSFTKSKF